VTFGICASQKTVQVALAPAAGSCGEDVPAVDHYQRQKMGNHVNERPAPNVPVVLDATLEGNAHQGPTVTEALKSECPSIFTLSSHYMENTFYSEHVLSQAFSLCQVTT
jgi:hypothetical protein